ncbi:MAG: hypothetical protein R3B60_03235 [Candidatus Paceibacterota bacterium]
MTVGGSLIATSTAVTNFSNTTFSFIATSSATITGPTIFGDVNFNGEGGDWTITNDATTTDFLISNGSVTAPSNITVTGNFINNDTFDSNSGTLRIQNDNNDLLNYMSGIDTSGSGDGTGTVYPIVVLVNGNYMYVGRNGNGTACSQTAGSAEGCELQVYDISSSTNPVYVAGRDSDGSAGGSTFSVSVYSLAIKDNYMYVGGSSYDSVACSQTAGSAEGCELQVYDISSSTNPVYVAGRDNDGSDNGTSVGFVTVLDIEINGNYLYLARSSSNSGCTETIGSAYNCKLQIYDISSSTNPIFVGGMDGTGDVPGSSDLAFYDLLIIGDYMYVAKNYDNFGPACSATAGGAEDCELHIYDISSSTNPIFVTARDLDGTSSGNFIGTIYSLSYSGDYLYAGSDGGVLIFNISSSTNPVYIDLLDVQSTVEDVKTVGNYLWVTLRNFGNANPCLQTSNVLAVGCELQVYDISSSTNPLYILGYDTSGSSYGSSLGTYYIDSFEIVNDHLYLAKRGDSTTCSDNVGEAIGCEFMILEADFSGVISGNLIGDNTLNNIFIEGIGSMADSASTTNFTVNTNSTSTIAGDLSVFGDYVNNGQVTFVEQNNLYLGSNSAQSLSGNLSQESALPRIVFYGSGNKTISSVASTTSVFVDSGSSVSTNYPLSTVQGITNNGTFSTTEDLFAVNEYVNTGDFNNTGNITEVKGYLSRYLKGVDASGSNDGVANNGIYDSVVVGDFLFIGKQGNTTACSQTAGSAIGCELQVYDISSSTNPVYVAGRDGDGSSDGTGGSYVYSLAVKDTYLFIGKQGNTTACSQTAGSAIGCELQVYDISSSTNPVYVAGRDGDGSSSGVSGVTINNIFTTNNYLYIAKNSNTTACSQTAGSAIGCELQVYDISSSTNPIYVAGRDADGSDNGIVSSSILDLYVNSNYLYIGKQGNTTACSQTAGSAIGCELQVYDISSSTNPIYVAGRDADGSSDGTSTLNTYSLNGYSEALYLGRINNTTACSQTAGSAVGCELMVFDISSSTNPVFVKAFDSDGSGDGSTASAIEELTVNDRYLYVGKQSNTTACSQTAGSAIGCELQVYDISSSTNPTYIAGVDVGGTTYGTQNGPVVYAISATGTVLYIGKSSFSTACSQTAGSAIGCELMVFDTQAHVSGSLTNTNSFNHLTIKGKAVLEDNASTTNLTISTSSSLTAPSHLTISGDLTNNGTYNANSGLVTLAGTSQSLISSATTTFYQLKKSVTSADTLTFTNGGTYIIEDDLTLNGTTGNLLSLRSASTSGEWYIDSQGTTTISYLDVQDSNNINVTTISCLVGCVDGGNNTNWNMGSTTLSLDSTANHHFYVGQASTTLDQITITKSSSSTDVTAVNDIRINISTTTTDFVFDSSITTVTLSGTASGKASSTVTYEDGDATLVIDITSDFVNEDTLIIEGIKVGSFSTISTTSGQFTLHTNGTISGEPVYDTRSINITGDLLIAEHSEGQVNNLFDFQNESDEPFFTFSLSPNNENATITDIVLSLSGVQNIDTSEFSDFKLYQDVNNDSLLDGGDVLLDSAGIMTIEGQNGAITFSNDFLVTATADYFMTADTDAIDRGDAIIIDLLTNGISTLGQTSNYALVVNGAVDSTQHIRSGAGAGGSSSRIGGSAPAGVGTETGGGAGGGGGADEEEEGENIVSDPNFFRPTATGDVDNDWTNPENAYVSDGVYSTAATSNLRQSYNGFNFGIPSGNTIEGIAVKLDASGTTASGTIDVALSWDSGSSYTTAKATPTLSGSDIIYTVGGSSDKWGRSWTSSEFNGTNFRLRITAGTVINIAS